MATLLLPAPSGHAASCPRPGLQQDPQGSGPLRLQMPTLGCHLYSDQLAVTGVPIPSGSIISSNGSQSSGKCLLIPGSLYRTLRRPSHMAAARGRLPPPRTAAPGLPLRSGPVLQGLNGGFITQAWLMNSIQPSPLPQARLHLPGDPSHPVTQGVRAVSGPGLRDQISGQKMLLALCH